MKSILKTFCVIAILSTFVIYACKKDSNEDRTAYSSEKSWLHKAGNNYKDETITVNFEGKNITGRLNWDNAERRTNNGRDYLYVPFDFYPSSKFVTDILPRNEKDKVNPTSFALVLSPKTDTSFFAALQTILYKPQMDGKTFSLENYYTLNGQWINSWKHDGATRPQKVYLQTSRTSKANQSTTCTDYVITTYTQTCVFVGGALNEVRCTVSPVFPIYNGCTGYSNPNTDGVVTGYSGTNDGFPPAPGGTNAVNPARQPMVYTPPLNSAYSILTDQLDSVCWKSIVNMIIGTGGTGTAPATLTDLIRNTFNDPSTKLDLRFYQSPRLGATRGRCYNGATS
jgi:hypothetical protein